MSERGMSAPCVDVDLRGPFAISIYNVSTMIGMVRGFAAGREAGDWITVREADGRVTCYEVTDQSGGARPLDPLP